MTLKELWILVYENYDIFMTKISSKRRDDIKFLSELHRGAHKNYKYLYNICKIMLYGKGLSDDNFNKLSSKIYEYLLEVQKKI